MSRGVLCRRSRFASISESIQAGRLLQRGRSFISVGRNRSLGYHLTRQGIVLFTVQLNDMLLTHFISGTLFLRQS